MWGEFVDSANIIPFLWARVAAVAERLWSPQETQNEVNSTMSSTLGPDVCNTNHLAEGIMCDKRPTCSCPVYGCVTECKCVYDWPRHVAGRGRGQAERLSLPFDCAWYQCARRHNAPLILIGSFALLTWLRYFHGFLHISRCVVNIFQSTLTYWLSVLLEVSCL